MGCEGHCDSNAVQAYHSPPLPATLVPHPPRQNASDSLIICPQHRGQHFPHSRKTKAFDAKRGIV
jgi:hypothetical protein